MLQTSTINRSDGLAAGAFLRTDAKPATSYRERIALLMKNPSIANVKFDYSYTCMPTPSWWSLNRDPGPKTITGRKDANCFGTVAWVFGIEKKIEAVWREAIRAKRSFEANGDGAYIRFAETDRPGYIGGEAMRAFLRFDPDVKQVREPMEGDIVTQWWMDSYPGCRDFGIKHAGIMLPDMRVFEKEGFDYDIRSDRCVFDLSDDVPSSARKVYTWFFRISRQEGT